MHCYTVYSSFPKLSVTVLRQRIIYLFNIKLVQQYTRILYANNSKLLCMNIMINHHTHTHTLIELKDTMRVLYVQC